MRPRGPSLRKLGAAAVASFLVCALCGSRLERAWVSAPPAQAAGDYENDPEAGGSQRLRQNADKYLADYGFRNFNRDSLSVHYEVPRKAFEAYDEGYGYYKKDIDAFSTWENRARQEAFARAQDQGWSQTQLDREFTRLHAERERKVSAYMAERGFRLLPGKVVESDVPGIVKRNTVLVKPVAIAIEEIASKRRYDSDSVIGAAASMVQTALLYRVPPSMEGERHTGGLWPPVTTLVKGWGDCDTKTTLLGAVLTNWSGMRLVGVAAPEHYLMGVLRSPAKGDVFVEHGGLQYVLVEPAGPAWLPPGTVADSTLALLQGTQGYKIEPFF